MQRLTSLTSFALMFILAQPINANAAEIKVWAARAMAIVLAEIGPEFERRSGIGVGVRSRNG